VDAFRVNVIHARQQVSVIHSSIIVIVTFRSFVIFIRLINLLFCLTHYTNIRNITSINEYLTGKLISCHRIKDCDFH